MDIERFISKTVGDSLSHSLYVFHREHMQEIKMNQRLEKMKQEILEETKAYIDSYIDFQLRENVGPAFKEIDKMARSIFK